MISLLLVVAGQAKAQTDRIHVAVASNFTAAMKQLVHEFEASTGHQVSVSYGSSGKFYAQILHGAPFHVFFSADQDKVTALNDKELTVKASQITYAVGRLALWSNKGGIGIPSAEALVEGNFNRIAIANPNLAPYGIAAMEVIDALNITSAVANKLIRGENIGQTYQFVSTGSAEYGFVAYAQILASLSNSSGAYWLVPEHLHRPIKQDAILLKRGEKNRVAEKFLNFVQSAQAQEIIESFGYQSATELSEVQAKLVMLEDHE
ncbi:molybdate ABC transporter substrate-binding protein [Thalassotalea fusca]